GQRRAYWAVKQRHCEVDFESGETDSPDRVDLYRGLCPRSNRLARWPESDNALAVCERCGATFSKIECRSRRALFERRALLYRRRHYSECRPCSRANRRRLWAARRARGRARAGRILKTFRRPETIFRAARVSD